MSYEVIVRALADLIVSIDLCPATHNLHNQHPCGLD